MDEKISRRSILYGFAAAAIPGFKSLDWLQNPQPAQTNTPSINSPVVNKINDRFSPVDPGAVQLQGFLGERCLKNERSRLLAKNEEELLKGFQNRPGKQAWVGEHAGKWLHAATLAWVYTRDEALRSKLERVATALMATQDEDGYLGTYAGGSHWSMGPDEKWDVWVHKYDLIGLITYSSYTGDKAALEASKKIGDLLVKTFGRNGQLNLNERSTHAGMASGSVLEPVTLLYRATADERYLDFARYIAERWEEETGPGLISALSEKKPVNLTANAKAYEMMSCLVGLCELYRATGENRYLTPAINAWNDIVANQLLLTGSGSSREHWTQPQQFPSEAKAEVAETCVTVTWIQLTQQLLRLTGNPRYADELEKTFYNHLAAAQRPDGAAWAYFTALDGIKPYSTEQNCCTSSGPRGWAMLPSFAYLTSDDGIVINFITPGTAAIRIDGETVVVKQETAYPLDGQVAITVTVPKPMKMSLRVRVPSWSKLDGLKAKPGDYWLLRQTWSRTQTIKLNFSLPVRVFEGRGNNAGRTAIAAGPLILAADQRFNPEFRPLSSVALFGEQIQLKTSLTYRSADDLPVYETEGIIVDQAENLKPGDRVILRLTPFASAGAYGDQFQVWLKRVASSAGPEK